MGDLISKSAYREKLVDYNRHLAAREEKATAEEDYEELNAIQNECRAYFMMLSLLDDMPTSYDVEAKVAELENFEMWKELLIYDLSHREREIIEKAISIVRGKE